MDRSTKWIIGLNLGLFVLLRIVVAAGGGINAFGISLPHPFPWTPLTYMFTQGSIIELLFNMLWLWCFCKLFLIAGTPKRMIAAYITGGLGGAFAFYIAWLCGLIPDSVLLGASASIISMAVCSAIITPSFSVNMLMIGNVSIRTIAIITVILSLLPFLENNPGGGWAHIGGTVAGLGCGIAMRHGWLPRFSRKSIKSQEKLMTLDSLLEKVRRSGYSSLTATERQRLIELSNEL